MGRLKTGEYNEREILLGLRDGSQRAFERLYTDYSSLITAHLLYLLKSAELAQEVAQDTFMSVWEHRANIDPDRSFKAYLYKIATNKTYNLFRRASYDRALRNHMLPIMEEGYNNIEAYINDKEHRELLRDLLEKMPAKQKEVFTLFKIEGYTYSEISERLGISHSTINTHINRANQYIKSAIQNNPEFMMLLLFSVLGNLSAPAH